MEHGILGGTTVTDRISYAAARFCMLVIIYTIACALRIYLLCCWQ